jgi:hypothetical protein
MFYTWFVAHPTFFTQALSLFWYHLFINSLKLQTVSIFYRFNLSLLRLILRKVPLTQGLHQPSFLRNMSVFTVKNVLTPSSQLLKFPDFHTQSKAHHQIINSRQTIHHIINLFFLINQSSDFQRYKPHANYRLMYLYLRTDKVFIFSPKRFFHKWQNIYSFLYNVFYFNHLPLVFGSKFFKKEIHSLNWYLNEFTLDSWRYASFFLTFYISIYNRKLNFFFKQLRDQKFAFALITDLEYHFKMLFYLRKLKWFTLALVPSNLNPWSVSVSLPIFKNDFYAQFFFIKLLVLIRKQALLAQHKICKAVWFDFKHVSNSFSLLG